MGFNMYLNILDLRVPIKLPIRLYTIKSLYTTEVGTKLRKNRYYTKIGGPKSQI